jgi:hypothetical protein
MTPEPHSQDCAEPFKNFLPEDLRHGSAATQSMTAVALLEDVKYISTPKLQANAPPTGDGYG